MVDLAAATEVEEVDEAQCGAGHASLASHRLGRCRGAAPLRPAEDARSFPLPSARQWLVLPMPGRCVAHPASRGAAPGPREQPSARQRRRAPGAGPRPCRPPRRCSTCVSLGDIDHVTKLALSPSPGRRRARVAWSLRCAGIAAERPVAPSLVAASTWPCTSLSTTGTIHVSAPSDCRQACGAARRAVAVRPRLRRHHPARLQAARAAFGLRDIESVYVGPGRQFMLVRFGGRSGRVAAAAGWTPKKSATALPTLEQATRPGGGVPVERVRHLPASPAGQRADDHVRSAALRPWRPWPGRAGEGRLWPRRRRGRELRGWVVGRGRRCWRRASVSMRAFAPDARRAWGGRADVSPRRRPCLTRSPQGLRLARRSHGGPHRRHAVL